MSGQGAEYDVFISHSSADKAWVTTLAKNLKQQGKRVWLDIWELKAGGSFVRGLEEGLARSATGVLVVTPEALSSGWVQDEYEAMLRRRNRNGSFRFVPVLLGDVHDRLDDSFIGGIHRVDFRDPSRYRRAFYELLCGLDDRAPGADGEVDGTLEIPGRIETPGLQRNATQFLDEVLDDLKTNPLTMLLVQEGMGTGPVASQLLRRAEDRFSPRNVYHLVPPCGGDQDLESYFAVVAHQCEIETRNGSEGAIRRTLYDRLNAGDRLFILLSDFENGPEPARRRLASLLRGLYDGFTDRIHIVFRGGEKLANLKYEQGDISILNVAWVHQWPDFTPPDVQELYGQRYPEDAMPSDEAGFILDATGGEPRLVHHCLKLRHASPGMPADAYREDLLGSDVVWQLFTPLAREASLVAGVRDWLDKTNLGPAPAYLVDAGLRRLYWRNLLARRRLNGKRRLCWRSEVLREIGREVLACA